MIYNIEKLNVSDDISNNLVVIYRAVSIDELIDILFNGFRTKQGGYETVKLFALNYIDAWHFGLNNQIAYDNLPYTVVMAAVPMEIYKLNKLFPADGMEAIAIEDKYLNLLRLVF